MELYPPHTRCPAPPPALDRRPRPRRRRAHPRDRRGLRGGHAARRQEGADAARPHRRSTVFFESSTRTSSLVRAGRQAALGRHHQPEGLRARASTRASRCKDTVLTLSAYDPDVIVIRHAAGRRRRASSPATPTPTSSTPATASTSTRPRACSTCTRCAQALGPLEGLHVAIVGDVLHSRVARSNIQGAAHDGRPGDAGRAADADPARGIEPIGVEVSHDIADIADADVVYVLRMQRERMPEGANYVPSLREYTRALGRHAATASGPSQLVMHPGPMNRGVEIAGDVADGANSRIVDQVRAGLVVRMAVLYDLLAAEPADARGRLQAGRCARSDRPGRRWRDDRAAAPATAPPASLRDRRRAAGRPDRRPRRAGGSTCRIDDGRDRRDRRRPATPPAPRRSTPPG